MFQAHLNGHNTTRTETSKREEFWRQKQWSSCSFRIWHIYASSWTINPWFFSSKLLLVLISMDTTTQNHYTNIYFNYWVVSLGYQNRSRKIYLLVWKHWLYLHYVMHLTAHSLDPPLKLAHLFPYWCVTKVTQHMWHSHICSNIFCFVLVVEMSYSNEIWCK